MIQQLLHLHYCALLDWENATEAEEDLRDAVVQETGRLRYDTAPVCEVEEMATWLAGEEERECEAEQEWAPDDLPELEQAFLRRIYDHGNDLREPEAAE